MSRGERRIVYWTLATLITVILVAPLAVANLGGWIILLPILPATPTVIHAWILQRRVYRQDLRDITSRPDWLP